MHIYMPIMDHLVEAHICASGKVSFFPLPNHEVGAFLADYLTSKARFEAVLRMALRCVSPLDTCITRATALWVVVASRNQPK